MSQPSLSDTRNSFKMKPPLGSFDRNIPGFRKEEATHLQKVVIFKKSV